jgi:MSHA biogenesis protein MshJ
MQFWQKFALRIDALTLRERIVIFGVVVLLLVVLINTLLLNPQYVKQTVLSQQIKQQQSQIADLQNQIQQKVKTQEVDPDKVNLDRFQVLKQRATELNGALADLQKGLVSPDRMADLLESVLKRNNKLLLVSLKTLPVTALGESNSVSKDKPQNNGLNRSVFDDQSAGARTLFKHTVELTVSGNYLDMLSYMRSLEGMPWQLFWGSAKLKVDEYPTATLTLTVFTLSLDKKWLNL